MKVQMKKMKGCSACVKSQKNKRSTKIFVSFSKPSGNGEKQKYFKTKSYILRVGGGGEMLGYLPAA
jgi:hypothetical protein